LLGFGHRYENLTQDISLFLDFMYLSLHRWTCSIYSYVLYKPIVLQGLSITLSVGLWIIFYQTPKVLCTWIKTILAAVVYPKTSCEWSCISNGLIWNFDISINLICKFSLLCEMFDRCTQLEYADIDMMCMMTVPWFVYLMFILIALLLLDDISQFYMFLRLCSSKLFFNS
jgi:hypothetical protein